MNRKTSLHIALATALLLAFGTGCASIFREPSPPNPASEVKMPPKLDAEPVAAEASGVFVPDSPSERPEGGTPEESASSAKDESSAPSPQPEVAVAAPKPALKKTPQPENIGLLSKTPVAQPPSAKPDGSLTRLDEMKKQGTMSEEAYGQIKRQILENPE